MTLVELAPGVSLQQVQDATEASFEAANGLTGS
jgi:acyl CoA:acetate/3-ketoacid CoA transferase beta subunit